MIENRPFVSLIIPCRNEQKYIATVLENILNQDYPCNCMEVFVVDGHSNDQTKKIAISYSNKLYSLKILDNPDRIVPYALNLAIKQSKGDYIIRIDAHTEYAKDYVSMIIKTFQKTNADIVGGPMRATGKSDFQKAVAYCTSTKMGVGDSQFHNEDYEGFVDSVYLGAWKWELFNEVGLFDERMKRNQDDEFHYRAKSKGKKIYLNPEIRSIYYPRSTVNKLFSQYYQYGLYKPLVLQKVKTEIKLRHLIPSGFVIYLIVAIVLLFNKIVLSIVPLLLYLILSLYFSAVNKLSLKSKFYCTIIYPTLHISYGTGFIMGIFKK